MYFLFFVKNKWINLFGIYILSSLKYYVLFKMVMYCYLVDEIIFEEFVWYEFGVFCFIKVGILNVVVVIGDELSVMICVWFSI